MSDNENRASRKVGLVTGASGNLGSAVAERLHAEKMQIVLTDRSADRLNSLAAKLGGDGITTFPADITDADQVGRLFAHAVSVFGGVDVVAHLAGGFRGGLPIAETSVDDWDFLLRLNARSAFLVGQAAAKQMRAQNRGGRILFIGARAALSGQANLAAYSASKSAVLRLTESLAAELLDQQITVNTVLPSTLDTPANRAQMPDADADRWVRPESIAEIVAFLASDAARDISGASLPVYGRA